MINNKERLKMRELIIEKILEMKEEGNDEWKVCVDIDEATNLELLEIYDTMNENSTINKLTDSLHSVEFNKF
jgi:hypothetical protein